MRKRDFKYPCEFKYDEERTGDTAHGKGYQLMSGRCQLRTHGNRECLFPYEDHKTCKISNAKKHKHPGKRRFKGKWVKE